MGIGFTVDSPVKVAKFGISSVVTLIEDDLLESMREVICKQYKLPFEAIKSDEQDAKARRVTAYLNVLNTVVKSQLLELKSLTFNQENDLTKYFELLPDSSELKQKFVLLPSMNVDERLQTEKYLKDNIVIGSIDVNIMTKVDKLNFDAQGNVLPVQYSDALSCLRGYAMSDLSSALIFSAGLNPRLYSYCAQFDDFFPDSNGYIKKRIILKVSDYRSALIQGKFLAKKGIWISEFRIESGINCGGHAFVSNGILFGPILEEFKEKRSQLFDELFQECQSALQASGRYLLSKDNKQYLTAQGGIGTAEENEFLLSYYNLDSTGWGSPFLMVPEATNVDDDTLQKLVTAKQEDYYLSDASPLGVPFNNLRTSTSEKQRKMRIDKHRPGSPCYKKYLSFDTEFTDKPICTASRQYQKMKIDEINTRAIEAEKKEVLINKLMEKDCLCEGLGVAALLKNNVKPAHKLTAVTICPGPNLAFFSGVFSLKQMVDHIYGRVNLLNNIPRPNLFLNELKLYLNYFKEHYIDNPEPLDKKKIQFIDAFKTNLQEGINYYQKLFKEFQLSESLFGQKQLQWLENYNNDLRLLYYSKNTTSILELN